MYKNLNLIVYFPWGFLYDYELIPCPKFEHDGSFLVIFPVLPGLEHHFEFVVNVTQILQGYVVNVDIGVRLTIQVNSVFA
jgi:hypothetical protein